MKISRKEQGSAAYSVGAEGSAPDGRSRTPFHQAVWAMVRRVPAGKASSYGAIAASLGAPRAARGVGWALSALPEGHDVPWWRIVNRNGEVSIKGAPGMPALQRVLLEGEGVRFDSKGRLDLQRFGWTGPEGTWSGSP